MRSTTGPWIGFPSPAVSPLIWAQGGVCGKESYSDSRAGEHGLHQDPRGPWRVPPGESPTLRPVDHPHLALTSGRGTTGIFGIELQAGSKLSDRRNKSCGPGDSECQGQHQFMDTLEATGPGQDAAGSEGPSGAGTRGSLAPEKSGSNGRQGRGPQASAGPATSQESFTSSFSFIQLSLGSAEERGEAEGCPPIREAEVTVANSGRSQGDPPLISLSFNAKKTVVQAAMGSPRPECERLSLSDTEIDSSCSSHPSLLEGSVSGDTHHWDTLLSKCQSLLLDCRRSNQRQLEVKSLRSKLQKLQEKAVNDDDYDKAELFKQRLEDLEQENSGLQFRLPSQQPALSNLLRHLGAQVQVALHQTSQQAGSENPHAPFGMEVKLLETSAQNNLCLSITRRDWLLQEKQQLQKEIKALQARMTVLEAKDHQLRREIEGLEQLLPWQGCDLGPLLDKMSLSELEEVSNALQYMLSTATQISLHAEPPETITSLQERIKSLNLSLKEITAKVCVSEGLCSTLRKKVNDIETQLPTLLEAKMLAISGSHFCTAKELTEEIQSLTSEREGLETLLNKLLVLSSRNVRTLGSIKEDYNRLRRELDQGVTAYEKSVKENTSKYMEVLEDKLRSLKCPLLIKVWEADLEACRLLLQSLKLQKSRDSLSAEDERQMDDLGGAACTGILAPPCRPHSADERKTSPTLEEWKIYTSPSSYCVISEQKEESHIFFMKLEEKCEAIGRKLHHLEEQLHTAIHNHDEDLIQGLKRELQMVKETLQTMIVQLQPAKEAGEREAAASCVTAGVREAQA